MPKPINDDPTISLRAMRRALSLSSFPIGILTLGIPFYGARHSWVWMKSRSACCSASTP